MAISWIGKGVEIMTEKHCVLCDKEIELHYYVLPYGYICSECGKKIIEHLKVVVND